MNASRSLVRNESVASGNGANMSDLPLSFDESVLQLMDEPFDQKVNALNLRTDFKYKGFDSTMGDKWIYPDNFPMRQYQLNISRVSLFKNTLVVLPTGLGKTFIASVVMYNIFRWYPKSKIIFMAPTRPLVAQQIKACYDVMAFDKDDTIELTGRQNKKLRATAWHSKRVFYCTPQVVWSDMIDNEIDFPFDDIKLVVVDEAHKAKGKYAYVEVVQSIATRNKLFRVLALTATPGRTMADVCEVVQNLLISNIEVRRENSIDVAPYVFKKNVKTIVVPLGERLSKIRERLYELVDPYVQQLYNYQVISGHTSNLSKAWLLFNRNQFRQSTISNRHPDQSSITGNFSVCISMYHAIELLERHGMRVFLNYFNENSPDSNAEEKFFVMKDANIKQFIDQVRQESGITPIPDEDLSFYGNLSNVDLDESIDYGHPKFEILQNCLLTHFKDNSDTKAIVFCEYRESVFLINRMLLVNRPLITPKVFVGQGSSNNRTITQKEQIAIMNDFRSGKCNTLIATCVAEEGIDVGEVDFIVCFDISNKNPIRFVQRIGRTGRKRQGKVTMLVSEGKEQQNLREVLATKDGINQRIAKANEIQTVLYKECPRLVPPEFNPKMCESHIEVKNTQEPNTTKKKSTKSTKAKNTKQKTKIPKKTGRKGDMRKFFNPLEIDEEIEENFDLSTIRDNTSAGHHNNTTNSMTDVQIEINGDEMVNYNTENYLDLTEDDHNQMAEENHKIKSDNCNDEVPLEVKFEQIYQRYCEMKTSQSKWNGFDVKFKKSAINDERVPSIIKDLITKCKEESNECRIFRTKCGLWSDRTFDDQMSVSCMMSLLKPPEELKAAAVEKIKLDDSQVQNSPPVLHVIETQPNVLEDSQLSFSMDHESKYASQLKPKIELQLPKMEQFTSSTPHKVSRIRQNPDDLMHSPIISTPLASRVGNKRQRNSHKRISKDDPKWYLKYLRLDSVSDLFSEDEFDENPKIIEMANEMGNKSKDQAAKLCDNLNKSVCGNESLIEEESQYTVSRILKICEDAERGQVDKNAANVGESSTTTRRKRLYIGSVNDLFCDDDDDDDDNDDIINTQVVDIVLSSSDGTVDYDVEDAIAQHRTEHDSTNLFKDTIDGETLHRSLNAAAKSVAPVKSDELFSSYNESVANTTKGNASHAKHTTNNNDREDQNIQTTPKKCNSSSFFAYYSRSPSVLFKSSSVLTTKFDNTHSERSANNTSKTSSNRSDKSPSLLSTKLSVLNSQLSLSKHFDDFDEIKDNFDINEKSSPFATCKSPSTSHRNQHQHSQNPPIDSDTDLSADDIFATCKPVSPVNKKQNGKVKRKRKPRGRFNFFDDEAAVSGNESSDEDIIATQGGMQIVTEHAEDDDPSVDMQAKYLQSIRSPDSRHRFRIPEIGYRNPVATQNIFSQFVAPDESRYEEDSFVVGSDEEIDSECTEISGDETDFDEITIAETRPNKRKSDDIKCSKIKKRRRIIQMSSDSD